MEKMNVLNKGSEKKKYDDEKMAKICAVGIVIVLGIIH